MAIRGSPYGRGSGIVGFRQAALNSGREDDYRGAGGVDGLKKAEVGLISCVWRWLYGMHG